MKREDRLVWTDLRNDTFFVKSLGARNFKFLFILLFALHEKLVGKRFSLDHLQRKRNGMGQKMLPMLS